MAQSLYQFDIDDDSPEIAYFPFVNTEPGSNVNAGWQLLYTSSGVAAAPGQVGVGTSYHFTSLNGASFLINWNGTGIDLIGSVGTDALYNVTLDGVPSTQSVNSTNNTLVSFNDLENTNHSLLLTTVITDTASPDAFLIFDKARIAYVPPAGIVNITAASQAISDSDVAYMGSWSYVTDSTGNSMHVSTCAGDRAQTTFQGSAITIYGLTSSYSGNFSVTLDNMTTNLSAISSFNNSNSLLFYATDLPQDIVHHIAVVNQENSTLALQAGGMNITCFGNCTTNDTSSSSSHSLSAGTIAAIVLGVVLLLITLGVSCYFCCVRRRAHAVSRRAILGTGRNHFNDKSEADVEQVPNSSVPSGELESTTLSTSKGYGFGLGLRRGFTFISRKSKAAASDSSGTSPNWTTTYTESHPMTPRWDRDEKLFSLNTLTEDFVVLSPPPESEKLAPGWSNPVARTPRSFKEAHGFILPELRIEHVGSVEDDYDDDADVKTLTSRQDEALAATLCLSPRTSEGFSAFDGVTTLPKVDADTGNYIKQTPEEQQPELLQVRDTSPFRVDMATIFGARMGSRDSRRVSGSGGSTWSKVRTRLYRRAHLDDGKQSYHADKQETSSSSGPESVPVVMHDSSSAKPPSETAPASGTYSFLDLASSHTSLRPHSKTITLSSTPAELGHEGRDISTWSENTSVRMVRVERPRDDTLSPKPDAPSTASGGSSPSDDSGARTASSPPAQTQRSSPISFSITLPSSTHTVAPSEHASERQSTPSPPDTPSPDTAQYLHVPQTTPPGVSVASASSPTESVPFSVSEIHFRHSFSDYAGLDSRRGSAASFLPPHPPLPRRDGSQSSQSSTPSYTPYIVQRVLGLAVSPLSPLSPTAAAPSSTRIPLSSSTITVMSASRPEVAPIQRARVGSLLGPRPRPSTAGSVRGSAAPQLPMQGGRGSLRNPRYDR